MKKLGIIGLGNMGSAILEGVIKNKVFAPKNIYVNDIDKIKTAKLKKRGVLVCNFNTDIAGISDIIILAVKPQDIRKVLADIKFNLNRRKIVISIAAGIKTSFIEKILNNNIQVIRVMPNMPILAGSGISAISKGQFAKREALDIAFKIFSSSGDAVVVDEENMDAVTAVSGSGPAYFFFVIDAIIKSGIKLGLKKEIAAKLAIDTAFGSIKLLADSQLAPEELIKKIASKGGTTEAALKVFKSDSLEGIIFKAVTNASKRSKKLGEALSADAK